MTRFTSALVRLFDLGDTATVFGRSMLTARYQALQKQVPLLYLAVLVNFIGLRAATQGLGQHIVDPASPLILLVLLRLLYWYRRRSKRLDCEAIQKELLKTVGFATLFSGAFSWWAMNLLANSTTTVQVYVLLFASLAALGCAYGLSSFPAAAQIPLLLLGLPVAGRLLLTLEPGKVGAGASVIMVTLLIARLLNVNGRGFNELIHSRELVAGERERALRAEEEAVLERRRAERNADTDPLTGLANRRSFLRSLEQAAASQTQCGVLVIVDLDGFKPVNDTFGHAAGDAVLCEISRRFVSVAPMGSVVARIGGDEFAVLVRGAAAPEAGLEIAQLFADCLQRPCAADGRAFQVSACCGACPVGGRSGDASHALMRADSALYHAKSLGRARAAWFTPDLDARNRRRSVLEASLRAQNVAAGMELRFQPIVNLQTGGIEAFEALARWRHPELGWISPAEFIPMAEHIGSIGDISDALLRVALRQAARWPQPVRLSFNLSAVQVCTVAAGEALLGILAEEGFDPRRLQIEVTETALLVDFNVARQNLAALREAGARIALDDFGAGNASITYLREIAFDCVKLDGALISNSHEEPRQRLLAGVLALCESIGVPCIAEHVETPGQCRFLAEHRCGSAQGFHLGKPLTASEARRLARAALSVAAEGGWSETKRVA